MSDREVFTRDQANALLGVVLESAHAGIAVFDLDRRVIACNRDFLEMFGLCDDSVKDPARVARAMDPRTGATGFQGRSLEDLWKDTSNRIHDTLRFPDGRVLERWVAPFQAAGRIVTFRDITEKARRDLDFGRQRAFLEKAQEVASIGSWVAELDDTDRLSWSPQMFRITGRPIDRTFSRTEAMAEILHPDDRETVRREREASLAVGPTFAIEHRITRPDGTVRWVHTRGELVRDAEGQPVRIIGTMQDITERRMLEDELRQSQKLEAIGRLAGGIAHDINNALTAVIGYTEQAVEATSELPAGDPLREDIREIQQAAERAEAVTRQLLTFSRKQALAPRLFQLEEAVHSMERMLARALGPTIELRSSVESGLPSIYGDRAQIEQAIVNLVVNAKDAMPDGGTLTILVAARTVNAASARRFESMKSGRYIELTVTDTGHGMDSATLARVFEPFFTTKAPGHGTGLGLAMVYGTVTQSGGFVFVESEPDRGTTFRVFFPIAVARERSKVGPIDEPAASLPEAVTGATILVAEDEAAVLRLVSITLRREGHRVLEADSAETALAIAEREAGAIDLLITDVNMPGMNGIDLAARLAEKFRALRVIVMTGLAPKEEIGPRLGASTRLLCKPFTPGDLRRIVRETVKVQ